MPTTVTGSTRSNSTQNTQRTEAQTPTAPAATTPPPQTTEAAPVEARQPASQGTVAASRRVAASENTGLTQRLSGALVPAPTLDAVRNGTAKIARGQQGDSVADLQRKLNEAGATPPLTADGQFGPKTEAAVARYQVSRGLPDTGVLGQQTLKAIDENRAAVQPQVETPPSQPTRGTTGARAVDTSRMTEAQKYDHFKGLIEENGGQFKSGPNERNLLSMRTPTNTNANGRQGVYDDKTVMLWTDSRGGKHVKEYRSNTEPSARYEGRMGEDVNGDGRRDLGRVRTGYYEFNTGTSTTLGNVLRPTRSMTVDRDTNHDGLFNDNASGSAGQSMLFHKGGNNMTGSAGCQTMPPAEYNRFWKDLNSGGRPGNIGYTLING